MPVERGDGGQREGAQLPDLAQPGGDAGQRSVDRRGLHRSDERAVPRNGNNAGRRASLTASLACMSNYDVVVIGGGAAGLSAALVLARARRAVAVVDAGEPRNAPAAQVHGFLSRDGLPPGELLALGRTEVAGYGGHLVQGRVDRVRRRAAGAGVVLFDVAGGGRPAADRADGSSSRPACATSSRTSPGVRERWGRDLLHCPYCHGYEVRDQPLAVLGGSAAAVQHAQLVRQWSPDVVLFPHTDDADRRRPRAAGRPRDRRRRRPRLPARRRARPPRRRGARRRPGRAARTAVFVRPRFVPHTDLLIDARLRHRSGRLGRHRRHRPYQRAGRLGCRQRDRPPRPGRHRGRPGLRHRDRPPRRPRRGGRTTRRPRPQRPRRLTCRPTPWPSHFDRGAHA